jgi:hypothetical protein
MTLGASKRQMQWLAGLGLLAAYSIYTNVLSGPDVPADARQARPAVAPAPNQPDAVTQRRLDQRKKMLGGRQSVGEFRPTLAFNKDTRPDPMKVDPTLRLDLLAKLQNVTLQGGNRSLFEIGNTPPPTADVPKIVPGAKVIPVGRLAGPMLFPGPKPPDPPKPVPPPPPPIPLKFYGFTNPNVGAGIKRAFFLEGEDIHVAAEGDTIKRRYKIVKIGVNSAVVEDTDNKHQQTLPLEQPPISG